jgi:hypothetical protein
MYRLADALQRIFDPLYKSERAPWSTAPVFHRMTATAIRTSP